MSDRDATAPDLGIELDDDQVAIREAFRTFFSRECPPEVVREAEPDGFHAALWKQLASMGVPSMGLGGESIANLAVFAHEAGRALAPVPFVESLVAARTLERHGACPAGVATGDVIATLTLTAPHDGVARLVPAGAVAGQVVTLVGGRLLAFTPDGPPPAVPPNLGSCPIADLPVATDGAVELAAGPDADASYSLALTEWRVLTAAALSGLAERALEIGVDYVKERDQFGGPIGRFQAIQHRLADAATAVDGAILLVRRAAAAAAAGAPRAASLASEAFLFASRVAQETSATCLHFHGGYGFMLEYDIQLSFRRAKAWALALGDPAVERCRLVELLEAEGWEEEQTIDPFRAGLRAFLAEHCPAEVIDRAYTSGTNHDWDLHRALGRAGYLGRTWPEQWGGTPGEPADTVTLYEEIARVGAPDDGRGIAELVAHTLAIVGTEHQQELVIPAVLAGEMVVCLGYSEPDSGSDVAAAKTTAVREDDEWVINGQKVFTSLAHESAFVFLLTRTNPDVPKHRGLTMFLVPTDAPGVEIAPIHTLGGERTNMTFYSDVRIPDAMRVGEVDGGWDVMNVALAFERQPTANGDAGRLLRRAVAHARAAGTIHDPIVADRLARVAVANAVGHLLGYRVGIVAERGGLPFIEGSMAKLFASEELVLAAGDLTDMLGAEGVLAHGAPRAAGGGWIEHEFRHSQLMTIFAGTSEIQRGIIAERHLGLPRSR